MPVPGRVDAALNFLRHADTLRNPPPGFEGMRQEPRDLTAAEQKVEDAALGVLLDYFECRADFGDDGRLCSTETKEQAAAVKEAEAESAKLKKRITELEAIAS